MNQDTFFCVQFSSFFFPVLSPSLPPPRHLLNGGTMSQGLKGIQSLSERHSVSDWIRFTQRVGGRTVGKEEIYSLFVSIITNRWNIQWIIIYLITGKKRNNPARLLDICQKTVKFANRTSALLSFALFIA